LCEKLIFVELKPSKPMKPTDRIASTAASFVKLPARAVLAAIAVPIFLSGCIRDPGSAPDIPKPPDPGQPAIGFAASIDPLSDATRVRNGAWEADDVIGVYMMAEGDNLADGPFGVNAPHRHTGGGYFSARPGDELFYPRTGRVDFAAYHPWRPTYSDNRYPIDVTDQSRPRDIDFIWSDNARGHVSGDEPLLEFRHVMSKLVFEVHDITGSDLMDLDAVVESLPARGFFDLPRGAIETISGSGADITALRVEDGDGEASTRSLEAIVFPDEGVSSHVEFRFADGDTGRLALGEQTWLGGKIYIYRVNVTPGGAVSMGGSVIVDWDDQNRQPGRHSVTKTDPDDGGGGGDPGGGDDPPEKTRYFVETMGAAAGEGPVGINEFTGWSNPSITVSDHLEGADIRTHDRLDPHIWFPSGVNADVRIEGLPGGYTNITLSYDITAHVSGGVPAALIRVWAGTTELTPWVTRIIASPGIYTRVVIDRVPDGVTSLRFMSYGGGNTQGMRIDNIQLEGTKK
jgi:hypothetical protein